MSREQIFSAWKQREALTEKMVPLVGELFREHNVETSVFGRLLVKRSVIDILKAHRFGRQIESKELTVDDTYPVLKNLSEMKIKNAHVDVAKLAVKYREQSEYADLQSFMCAELTPAIAQDNAAATDVVLYGFGRIGRLLARLLLEQTGGGSGMRLSAIVVRKGKAEFDLEKRASLLRRDSVHGAFKGNITVDNENHALIANGNLIKIIFANSPDEVDYTKHGISNALVIDNTGIWRDEESLSLHLKCPGVAKVLLTAPGKGIKNIVMGVNQDDVLDDDKVVSAASCTTNAITPVLKAMCDEYGVVNGHVETIHSFTNDQNLIDNYHKGDRRGRAATLNMVITETGAAKAVSKALPEMEGKLSGSSIRVPTPNVSIAILNLNLEKEADKESLNQFLRDTAQHSNLQKQIGYSISPEAVSTDFVGSRSAGTVDALATIAEGGKSCVIYVWYDNEFGYSCQVMRLAKRMTRHTLTAYPVEV